MVPWAPVGWGLPGPSARRQYGRLVADRTDRAPTERAIRDKLRTQRAGRRMIAESTGQVTRVMHAASLVGALLTLAFALAACGGSETGGIGTPCDGDEDCPVGELCQGGMCAAPVDAGDEPPLTPEIAVAPTALDFGSAPLGTVVALTVTVTNAGAGPLAITRIELLESDSLAEFTAAPAGDVALSLGAGESVELTVMLTQRDGEVDRGELRLASNDADEPVVVVALESDLKGQPELEVTPAELDFGVVPWGGLAVRDASLTNAGTGNVPLVVTTVELDGDAADGAFALEFFVRDPGTGAETATTLPVLLSVAGSALVARVAVDTALLASGPLPDGALRIVTTAADPPDAERRVPILGAVLGCAAPSAELCNGRDDDCDLVIDNGDPGAGAGCLAALLGACQAGTLHCVGGATTCVGLASPASEACNGLDDDCDGDTDESLLRTCTSACGVGIEFCVVGTFAGCNAPTPAPEGCNGFDDDCDGAIDEGNPGGGGFCATGALGACAAGSLVCVGASLTCEPVLRPVDETCNGVDDDCDGTADEGDPGGGADCASTLLGICAGGVTSCAGGALGCEHAFPMLETCNGLDDDCDGTEDDGTIDAGGGCDGGDLDLCVEGARVCTGGVLTCAEPADDARDLCNDLDDDCDPATVDGSAEPTLGSACDAADTDLCAEGFVACIGGALVCEEVADDARDLCNNIDDDCNPATADGSNEPTLGAACDGADADLCVEGALACPAGALAGALACSDATTDTVELCGNSTDEDCDGVVNEGCGGDGTSCSRARVVNMTTTFTGNTCGSSDAGSDLSCGASGSPEHTYEVQLAAPRTVSVQVTGFITGGNEGDVLYRGTSCPGSAIMCTEHNTLLTLSLAAGSHFFLIEDDHAACQAYTVVFTIS